LEALAAGIVAVGLLVGFRLRICSRLVAARVRPGFQLESVMYSVLFALALLSAHIPRTEWSRRSDETAWRLSVDGRHVGSLEEVTGLWTSADGTTMAFGLPRVQAESQSPSASQMPPGGVDPTQLDPSRGETFTVNGQRVDRKTAYESLWPRTGPGLDLVDDSTWLRLTVIGPPADRKKVVEDLKSPKYSELLTKVIVRDYAPDDWAVQQVGFVTSGKPTIYIQAPSGKVLHRQNDYEGGAERLAGAIRKARPDYDPKKDPDLTRPPPAPPAPAAPAPAPVPATQPFPYVQVLTAAASAFLIYWFGFRRSS
jgi:hypothetical protein